MGRHNADIKRAALRKKVHVRKNDVVVVIAGRDKGKSGRVLDVDRINNRALVEGVNLAKVHTRPNPAKQIKGGIAERENSLHLSNLMLMASDGKPTRIGCRVETTGGKARRVRIAKRTGEALDQKSS
jgi:large subunit ribosomal protein L24